MAGFNPYQIAQSRTGTYKDLEKLEDEGKTSKHFLRLFKKKMVDDLTASLQAKQEEADEERSSWNPFKKILNVASLFDPTGLVKGVSSVLTLKNEKKALKKMQVDASGYAGGFLSKPVTEYSTDVAEAVSDLDKGSMLESFALGTLTDFGSKKWGGAPRAKISDVTDTFKNIGKGWKEGFQKYKSNIGFNPKDIIDVTDTGQISEKMWEMPDLTTPPSGGTNVGVQAPDLIKNPNFLQEGKGPIQRLLAGLRGAGKAAGIAGKGILGLGAGAVGGIQGLMESGTELGDLIKSAHLQGAQEKQILAFLQNLGLLEGLGDDTMVEGSWKDYFPEQYWKGGNY